MDDRRCEERVNVDAQIDVMDLVQDKRLGVLMDLSPGGLMMSTAQEIETGQLFQLCLALPGRKENGEACSLQLGAESVWRQDSPDGSHAWIGFHIIDISDEDSARIDEIIEEWGK